MSPSSATELSPSAQDLAAEIASSSADILREVAELLDATPDHELFGDTEFRVRAKVLRIVAQAFTARLAQKKTATAAAPSPAPTASVPPRSTATANDNPSAWAAP
jgi:hypothetical protein